MERTVKVCVEEGGQIVGLPLEGDDSLLLSTLKHHFPKARGLRYYTEVNTIRGVKLSQGKFYPPDESWGNKVYYCAFLPELDGMNAGTDEEASAKEEPTTVAAADTKEEHELESEDNDDSDAQLQIDENSNDMPESRELLSPLSILGKRKELSAFPIIKMKKPSIKKSKSSPETTSARRPHKCDICGNCFTQQSHMQRHRRIHTGEKPFACELCEERFSRSDKLKLHVAKCHPTAMPMRPPVEIHPPAVTIIRTARERQPKVLDQSYEWGALPPNTKAKNLTVKFKKTPTILVDAEQEDYYSVVSMAEVKMEEEDDSPFAKPSVPPPPSPLPPSPLLPQSQPTAAAAAAAVAASNEEASYHDDNRDFKCTICFKKFAKKNQLQRHFRIHTGERPFKCHTCEKSFTRSDALNRHTASVGHMKQKKLVGGIDGTEEHDGKDCTGMEDESNGRSEDGDPQGFELRLEDEEGDDESAEDDDVETSCELASLAQVTYANSDHTKAADREGENSQKKGKENYCQQCDHSFTNQFHYNRHMQSHNTEKKSYRCEYCHYVFRRQSHLTRHVLIHTGEKPFACKYCDERFSRSDKLRLHVKRTHEVEDTYVTLSTLVR